MTGTTDQPETLYNRLHDLAVKDGGRTALNGPGVDPLSYADLVSAIDAKIVQLHAFGLGCRDRICVVAQSGPQLASAVLTIACGAVCVPLNPKIADRDWTGYFTDFGISALVVEAGMAAGARAAADELGIPVIDLVAVRQPQAGYFDFQAAAQGQPTSRERAGPDDDALLLPTSGTTSRPKVVPLTHANIRRSADNMANAIELTRDDRLLNVLPLHHSYGLISGLITTVCTGAEIVCFGAFGVEEFFAALDEYRPTWMMGVPAIFDAIVSHAERHRLVPSCRLRLLHSSASPLPAQSIDAIERLFDAPLIETYGMTEAASQIASNPMPPGARRRLSVGRAAGPELQIIDPAGTELPQGGTGEVVVRGENLTRGYQGVPRARDWTPSGWFRTGDLGYLDAEGYLFLVGRLKEMINRGGEKISPQKVEQVIMEHPEVAEAAAFPYPHPRLGEEVGIAVVKVPGASVTSRGLRRFAALSGALSMAETPRFVALVDAIPRTATGKPQRLRLADRLARPRDRAAPTARNGSPHSKTMARIAQILSDTIGIDHIGDDEDFFVLGGDSLSAVKVILHLREEFGVELDLRALFAAPTVAELTDAVVRSAPMEVQEDPAPQRGTDADHTFKPTVVQERMLTCARSFPALPVYNLLMAFRITGALDTDALTHAVGALVSRHEALRTGFQRTGDGYEARVHPASSIETAPVTVEDWSAIPRPHQDRLLKEIARTAAWEPIELGKPPLFRTRLLRFGDGDYSLFFVFHHIICDAWSIDVLLEDLSAFYAMSEQTPSVGSIPPAPAFSAFARAQREWCRSNALEQSERAGAAAPEAGGLPTGFSTGRLPMRIADDLVGRLRAIAGAENATLFVALLTGLRVLLGAEFADWDAGVLTPMANRTTGESASMLGLMQNQGIVQTDLSPEMTFSEAMRSVREAVLTLQADEKRPIELLSGDLLTSDHRLNCDYFFSLISDYGQTFKLPGAAIEPDFRIDGFSQPILPVDGAKVFFTIVEENARLHGMLTYKETTIDGEVAEDMLTRYVRILERAARHPKASLAQLADLSVAV